MDYEDFVADPVAVAESLYAHFGLRLSGAAADAMRALRRSGTTAGAPAHHYSLSEFGLTDAQVAERFML